MFVKGGEAKIRGKNGKEVEWIFDFRPHLLNGIFLKSVAYAMTEKLRDYPRYQVGGQETAAIPLVTALSLLAAENDTTRHSFYMRKSRKSSEFMRYIEGVMDDSPVILIDDVLSSGTSMMRQIDILEKEGKKVIALCTIIRFHDIDFYRHLTNRGVEIISLFSLEDFPGITYATPPAFPPMPFTCLWKFNDAEPNYFYIVPKSAPVIDDTNVYFGTDDGFFRALRQSDGKEMWHHRIQLGAHGKYIFSSPALHEGIVYFGAYDGVVYAVHTIDGSPLWTFSDSEWVSSSPALAPDIGLLFIGIEQGLHQRQGGIVALDMKTGKKKWWAEMPAYTASSPLYAKEFGVVVIGCNDGVVRVYEALSGRVRWSFQTKSEVKTSFALDSLRGTIIFGSFDGHVYVLNIETGEEVHTLEFAAGFFSTPVIEGDYAYVGGLDRKVHCIDLERGNVKWSFETNGRVFASPVFIHNELFIGSNDGWLYVLNPSDGSVLGLALGTERIVNKIAYNPKSGRIFLPTHACELLCLTKSI